MIDLHLHLDGSLSLKSVKELAGLQHVALPTDDEKLRELLQVEEDCRDLNDYLEKFEFPLSLLQTREAIRLAVFHLLEELKEEGLVYAEIRFAPQLHRKKGLTQEEVVEAAVEGLKQSDLPAGLILCCMRGDRNEEENRETVLMAKRYLGKGVCALDLAGAEGLYPTENFAGIFSLAQKEQIPFTIHAGEAAGPDSVYEALRLGAARIGHGVRSAEDEELMARLSEKRIPLELCPTSNLNTHVYENLKEYPLRKLLDAGVLVTINTDNRMVSGTNLHREYEKLIQTFALTDNEVKQLYENAIEASFADSERKSQIRQHMKNNLW